ncbi:alpha/beta hydrolase [Streptomyces sp. INA 01156]
MEEAAAARAGDAGRFWTWAAEGCATWPAVAADRYRGPWDKPTAHPVLVVGTTYDPATPYSNAQAMVEELANARLLTNDGYGHTALINPSSCVTAHESRYLVDGTLPPVGTTCRRTRLPSPRPSLAVSPPAAAERPAPPPEPAGARRSPPPAPAEPLGARPRIHLGPGPGAVLR